MGGRKRDQVLSHVEMAPGEAQETGEDTKVDLELDARITWQEEGEG